MEGKPHRAVKWCLSQAPRLALGTNSFCCSRWHGCNASSTITAATLSIAHDSADRGRRQFVRPVRAPGHTLTNVTLEDAERREAIFFLHIWSRANSFLKTVFRLSSGDAQLTAPRAIRAGHMRETFYPLRVPSFSFFRFVP